MEDRREEQHHADAHAGDSYATTDEYGRHRTIITIDGPCAQCGDNYFTCASPTKPRSKKKEEE